MYPVSATDRRRNGGAYLARPGVANGSSLVVEGDVCGLGNRSLSLTPLVVGTSVDTRRDHAREAAAWSANENAVRVGEVTGAETDALDTNRDMTRLCMHRKWSTSPRWLQRTTKHPQ